jgi:hypothetical protein
MQGQLETAMNPSHDRPYPVTDLNPGSAEHIADEAHSTETFVELPAKMVTHFTYPLIGLVE